MEPRTGPRGPGRPAPPAAQTPPDSAVRAWGWARRLGAPHPTPSPSGRSGQAEGSPSPPQAPRDEFPLRGPREQSQPRRGGRVQAVSWARRGGLGGPAPGQGWPGVAASARLPPVGSLGKDGLYLLSPRERGEGGGVGVVSSPAGLRRKGGRFPNP